MGEQVTSITQLKRGMLVRWAGVSRSVAKESGVRSLGRVVTRKDYPYMVCKIGIACLDDPHWVLDPKQLLERGRVIRMVEGGEK